jgi:hypothetical protein
MTQFAKFENDGRELVATTWWQSEQARAGKVFCSCNAGAIRLLLPRQMESQAREMRTAKYVIVSRGPWPQMQLDEAVELLFEDGSDSPFCLHLSASSFDLLPADPGAEDWVLSVWAECDGRPNKLMELPTRWRRSAQLPDLRAWEDT